MNGITAWLFASGRKGDLNIRGAYMHMLADAAVSAGVVGGGPRHPVDRLDPGSDPLTSLVIVGVIVAGTWGLLRDSVVLSLNACPGHRPGRGARCLAERPCCRRSTTSMSGR